MDWNRAPCPGPIRWRGLTLFSRACLKLSLVCAVLVVLLPGNARTAEPGEQRSLALEGQISAAGDLVEFNWPKAKGSKVGRVVIQRRVLGEVGRQSWQDHDSVRGFARIYRDEDVQPGIAYEYRIFRPSKERTETAHWTTGVSLPATEIRGVALLVVDETVAADIAARLERFMLDLVGDGWKVVRRDVARGDHRDARANLRAARKLRSWIQDRYNSAHYLPHALILVGHVPVVKSGLSRPDGHKSRPLETDLFYAEMNSIWLDDGEGVLQHASIPGDNIEIQVGRIDFSMMGEDFPDEVTLLKRYLDKNHHWRHARLGDLRQAYGNSSHLFVELDALRNIVGPENFVSGGHHDAGRRQPWLLGVDFGSASYSEYVSPAPIKTIFSINFGSGKLDFSRRNNTMTAMLAQPWYGLTTAWGARPAWQLHHLAMGKSIGYSHLRTVNNGSYMLGPDSLEYAPTGNYPWINPVWVNLLGDPTLSPFPLRSVTGLRAEKRNGSVQLDWNDAGAGSETRYRIYRADSRFGAYRALNPAELHNGHQYVDKDPLPGAWYMVRAHTLKKVHAGSFMRFSQGSFATPGNRPPQAEDQSLSTSAGQKVALSPAATDADDDSLIITLVRDSDAGRLEFSQGLWWFVPGDDFNGQATIAFSVFDGVTSDDGSISINVTQP